MKKHHVRAEFIFPSSFEIFEEEVSKISVLGFKLCTQSIKWKGDVYPVPVISQASGDTEGAPVPRSSVRHEQRCWHGWAGLSWARLSWARLS